MFTPKNFPSEQSPSDPFALHKAVLSGNVSAVQQLLDVGCNINALDENKLTPLNYAVNVPYFNVVKLLVDSGADLEITNQAGRTPLEEADRRAKQYLDTNSFSYSVDGRLIGTHATNFAQTAGGQYATPQEKSASRQIANGKKYEDIRDFLIEKGANADNLTSYARSLPFQRIV